MTSAFAESPDRYVGADGEGRRQIAVDFSLAVIVEVFRCPALTVNGSLHDVDIDPDTPLLWAIRGRVGLTGTKYGCGIAR
jgi:hypothetical protein